MGTWYQEERHSWSWNDGAYEPTKEGVCEGLWPEQISCMALGKSKGSSIQAWVSEWYRNTCGLSCVWSGPVLRQESWTPALILPLHVSLRNHWLSLLFHFSFCPVKMVSFFLSYNESFTGSNSLSSLRTDHVLSRPWPQRKHYPRPFVGFLSLTHLENKQLSVLIQNIYMSCVQGGGGYSGMEEGRHWKDDVACSKWK